MEDNKGKKQDESLWKKSWDTGYHYIPILLGISIVLILTYCSGHYIVKKDRFVSIEESAIIASLERDTAKMESLKKDSVMIALLDRSSSQDTVIAHLLTLEEKEPNEENKGSYLSLWAATLAVIFVVFSIFGVLKLELTKKDIEEKFDRAKELEKDVEKNKNEFKKSQEEINELVESSKKKSEEKFNEFVELSKKAQDYSSLIHRMSIHFIASMNDNIFTRKRRIKEVDHIMDKLKSIDLNIDNYELLYGIFSMCSIKECQEEEGERMKLIIKLLNRDRLTMEKHILLGKSYYRLYSCIDSADSKKQDCLNKSIISYISILPSEREDILSILPIGKTEIINPISNENKQLSTTDIEIKDIQFELSRALYDYALNYCDENLKQVVLQKASTILDAITK